MLTNRKSCQIPQQPEENGFTEVDGNTVGDIVQEFKEKKKIVTTEIFKNILSKT